MCDLILSLAITDLRDEHCRRLRGRSTSSTIISLSLASPVMSGKIDFYTAIRGTF